MGVLTCNDNVWDLEREGTRGVIGLGLRSKGDTQKKAEIREAFLVGQVPNMNSNPKDGGQEAHGGDDGVVE